jgi:acyl-CoA thioesterase-1
MTLFLHPLRLLLFTLLLAIASALSLSAADLRERVVVFFGDSLTAGYGLDDPASQAYPALIQQKLTAAGLRWRVVNAGLSGETTSGGARRVDWILRQPIDIFVLALGANDGLRGIDVRRLFRITRTSQVDHRGLSE